MKGTEKEGTWGKREKNQKGHNGELMLHVLVTRTKVGETLQFHLHSSSSSYYIAFFFLLTSILCESKTWTNIRRGKREMSISTNTMERVVTSTEVFDFFGV